MTATDTWRLVDDLRGKPKRPPTGFPRVKESEVWENSIGMKMALLPAGEFLMGSPDTDQDAEDWEKPQHRVQITQPFLMGVYPLTQEQYIRVARRNPSKYSSENQCPVENVRWDDAIAFCNQLSIDENLTPYYDLRATELRAGTGYRLPTEAEWEYACRAGSSAAYCFGDDADELHDYAWFHDNSNNETHPIGQKQPNAWGLYDMHGNVCEWCQDSYADYGQPPVSDPRSYRVFRGGSWDYSPRYCRSAYRYWRTPDDRFGILGFRVARSSVSQPSQ